MVPRAINPVTELATWRWSWRVVGIVAARLVTGRASSWRRGLALVLFVATLSCGAAEPMSQFGNYPRTHQYIHLPGCDSLKVFRIKYWVFDYDSPAVQLEYSSPTHVADSASSYALAGRIWKSFEPYADAAGIRKVILTETVLDTVSIPPLMTSKTMHFGVILSRDSSETWRFKDSGKALPARSMNDDNENLSDVNGAPMSTVVFAKEMNEIIGSVNKQAGNP